MLSKAASSTIFVSLVWFNLGLNPGLRELWKTLDSLGQWPGILNGILTHNVYLMPNTLYIYIYIYIYICFRLSIIWKSDLNDKMKRSFFQAAVASILLYGCTTWTLTKRLEKKLDGNYTRMLRAILNKYWRQHPTRHQLYDHLPPITKTIQVRRTRHAGHCWRSRDELISDVLLWIPTHGRAKAGRPARTYIQQLCEDTGCCPEDLSEAMNDREKWRERVRDISATSMTWWWWYIYIYIYVCMYIYCHPQADWFVVSQLYCVARHAGRFKLGPKPTELYTGLCIKPLSHFGYIGPLRDHDTLVYAFVCLHFVQSDSRVLNSLEEFCIMRVASVN